MRKEKHPLIQSPGRTKEKPQLSMRELADLLDISLSKAYQEVRANRIPNIRLQRRIIIPRVAIYNWLESCGKAD